MNIQDSSSVVYWTNSTERKEDYNTTRAYTDTADKVIDYMQMGWFPNDVVYTNGNDSYQYYDHATNQHFSSSSSQELYDVAHRNTANLVGNSTSVSFISTNPPGTRTWPMWIFWVVACTLILGSIVIPVIGSRVFRYLARSFVKVRTFVLYHRKRSRFAASIFWFG